MRIQAFSRKKIAVSLAVLAVLGVGAAAFAVYGLPRILEAQAEQAMIGRVAANADAADAYASVQKAIAGRRKEPDNPAWYIQEGEEWGVVADVTHEPLAKADAVAAYERGVAVFGDGNTILIVDLGNAYRDVGRFDDAEKEYRRAIAANPGESRPYEALIDLYRFSMRKPPSEVIPVFQQALSTLVDNARVTQTLAEYLVSIGRDKDAIQYYELLDAKFPGQYDEVLKEEQAKLAASSTGR